MLDNVSKRMQELTDSIFGENAVQVSYDGKTLIVKSTTVDISRIRRRPDVKIITSGVGSIHWECSCNN